MTEMMNGEKFDLPPEVQQRYKGRWSLDLADDMGLSLDCRTLGGLEIDNLSGAILDLHEMLEGDLGVLMPSAVNNIRVVLAYQID